MAPRPWVLMYLSQGRRGLEKRGEVMTNGIMIREVVGVGYANNTSSIISSSTGLTTVCTAIALEIDGVQPLYALNLDLQTT